MRLFYDGGITIDSGEFKLILDSTRRVEGTNAFTGVSHAHSDHVREHSSKTYMTSPTSELFPFECAKESVEYGKKFRVDGMEVSLHNANHILGSAQFLVEGDEAIAYTGDIRMQESPFFEKPPVLECDTLIMESTYGLPIFRFPSWDEISADMSRWAEQALSQRKNVLIGGYTLGKSQEITKLLNDAGITPVVYPEIQRINEIYCSNGKQLESLSSTSPEGKEVQKGNFVAIVPQRLMNPVFFDSMKRQHGKKLATALATGWGKVFPYPWVERVFQLSDHCDFGQLVEYAKQSGARQVHTVHGYTKQFAASLRKEGINASPFEPKAIYSPLE